MKPPLIIFICQQDFRDQEYADAVAELQRYRYAYETVSFSRQPAIGEAGTEVEPTLALGELNPKKCGGFILIGGSGVSAVQDEPALMKNIQLFRLANRITAGVSEGVLALGNAGILLGRRATGLPDHEQQLKDRGAEYTGMAVVHDGLVVTGKDWTTTKLVIDKILYEIQ